MYACNTTYICDRIWHYDKAFTIVSNNGHGCESVQVLYKACFDPEALGVTDKLNDNLIYPNPASEYLKIDVSGSNSVVQLRLTDLYGKLVVEYRNVNEQSLIDIRRNSARCVFSGDCWFRSEDAQGKVNKNMTILSVKQ